MGANCCSSVTGGINDIYELSTGQWDVENVKSAYSKNRKLVLMKKQTLKTKNKIDIDMKISDHLEPLESITYYKNQQPSDEDNFVDQLFKPKEESIVFVDKKKDISKDITSDEIKTITGLSWKRPSDIFRTHNYYLYKTIEPNDIKQGMLGNCYFLSSIAAIAEFRERIEKIIVENDVTKNGQYGIRLYIQGEPVIVIIDDHFPCANSRHAAFTHCRGSDNEIWVSLIEKAWAKINGSYAMTIAGLPSEGLSTLTEAPTVTYIHKKYSADKIWEILLDADKRDYIICTCTQGTQDLEEKAGLVPGHAYTIISAFEIGNLRLLKIRNPWGQFEWRGDYADNSPLWNDELKRKVNYTNEDDGIFYMSFPDFLKYFPYSFVCKFEREFKYYSKKFLQIPDETMVACKINITKPTRIMINLHQKSSRIFNEIPNYKTNMSRIVLCKYHSDRPRNYEYIKSHSSTNEKLHLELNKLEPGEYHIFSHVNWPYQGYKNDYVISTYAEELVPIEPVIKEEIAEDFLHNILYSYLEQNVESKKLKENLQLEVSSKDNDLGFYMMLFKNTSKDESQYINFDVDLNKPVRLCTSHPHLVVNSQTSDHKNYTLNFNIEPDVDYLVLFELEDEPWYSNLKIDSIKVTTKKGVKADPQKGVLRKYLKNLTKQSLSIDGVFVSELESDFAMFLIFSNELADNIKMQVTCSDLINLRSEQTITNLYVESKDFSYIKLPKIDISTGVDFKYAYSIKKLLI